MLYTSNMKVETQKVKLDKAWAECEELKRAVEAERREKERVIGELEELRLRRPTQGASQSSDEDTFHPH